MTAGVKIEGDQERAKRRKLPGRRQDLREKIQWFDPFTAAGLSVYVTGGVDPVDGTIRETFLRPGGKAGKNSLLERLLDDAAVLVSLCLQHGMTVYELADALGAVEATTQLGNASPIGEAVVQLCRFQAEINGWPPGAAILRPPPTVPKKGEAK